MQRVGADELAKQHLDFALMLANRVARGAPDYTRDGLISAAQLALCEAANRFDAAKGVPFMAYAQIRINGALMDELRAQDWMNRDRRVLLRKVYQAIEKLGVDGHTVTDAEVAQVIGRDEATVRSLLADDRKSRVMSLDFVVGDPNKGSTTEELFISPDLTAEQLVQIADQNADLRACVDQLSPRLREVIVRLFWRGETQYEVADTLGVAPSRVSQLKRDAVARLGVLLARKEAQARRAG